MDKKLIENYRDKIIIRSVFMLTAALFTIIYFFVLYSLYGENLTDIEKGFLAGCIPAVCAALICRWILNLVAANNPKTLEKKYIRETDEREIHISQKSATLAFGISSMSLFIATVTAAFFNQTVFLTLFAVLIFIGIIEASVYVIYKKKK